MRVLLVALIATLLHSCGAAAPAWVDRVDALRATADRQVEQARLADAEATLRRIFTLPTPHERPNADALLRDAHFALGRVLLLQGRAAEALAEADAGLARGRAADVFTANLHALRAMSLEALGRELDALADYERAQVIHKALFDAALRKREGGA